MSCSDDGALSSAGHLPNLALDGPCQKYKQETMTQEGLVILQGPE